MITKCGQPANIHIDRIEAETISLCWFHTYAMADVFDPDPKEAENL
jgi:hypothetical protein